MSWGFWPSLGPYQKARKTAASTIQAILASSVMEAAGVGFTINGFPVFCLSIYQELAISAKVMFSWVRPNRF